MSGLVYRIHDFDWPDGDENLGALSLGEVEDLLDVTIPAASNWGWEATFKAGNDVYIYVAGSKVYCDACRDNVRDAYDADNEAFVDYEDWSDQYESDFDYADFD